MEVTAGSTMGSSSSLRANSANVVISKESDIKENMKQQQGEQDVVSIGDGSDNQNEDKCTTKPEDSEAKSSKKGKKDEKELFEEWKPKFDEGAQYLEECTDYAAEEVFDQMANMFEASKKKAVRKALSSYVTQELKFAKLFVKVWHSLATDDVYDENTHKQASKNLKRFKIIYWNFSDTSQELCISLHEHHALELLLKELDNPLLGVEELKSDSLRYHFKATIGILMNAVRLCDACRSAYRKANAVALVSKYEKSTYLIIKAKALLLLSYIVDEHESESLTASDGSVEFILNLLREALKSSTHVAKSYGFGAAELLQGLVQLASLENNKVKIGLQGGIYVLCRVLALGYSEEEQVLAAKALWSLAFVDINRHIIKLCDGGTRTKALKDFQDSEIPELKEACQGTLWEVYGGDRGKYCEVRCNMGDGSSVAGPSSNTPHIMISYQWDVQQRMIELRERLRLAGYSVWMDVEKMEGDLLVAMADAVENAAVVLVCLSQKYKESQNCRTEASYAYKQNKDIVPLLVEGDYTPDGWLGALVGMLKYFKFVSDEQVPTGLPPLLQELGSRGKVGAVPPNGPIVPVKAATVSAPRLPTPGPAGPAPLSAPRPPQRSQDTPDGQVNVNKWTSSDVEKWLNSKDLSILQPKLQSCNGRQLTQMYNHFHRAPDFFLNSLKNDLNMDYFTILNFTAALDDLFS